MTTKTMSVDDLVGETFAVVRRFQSPDDELWFERDDGSGYALYHRQDCCESVSLEDVVGDLADLVGVPILSAEETTNATDVPDNCRSCTWTFYHIRTVRGSVTLRWLGESNGYYCEEVDMRCLPAREVT